MELAELISSNYLDIQQLALNLSLNDLGVEGAISLGQRLSQLTQLQDLNLSLRTNLIEDQGMG